MCTSEMKQRQCAVSMNRADTDTDPPYIQHLRLAGWVRDCNDPCIRLHTIHRPNDGSLLAHRM